MPVTRTRSTHRRKTGFGSTIAIVVVLHFLMATAILWIATTETGQKFYKEVRIKFYQPPKPEEPKPEETAKEEPPPEPEKPEEVKETEEVPEAPVSERVEAPGAAEEVSLARSGDPFAGGPGRAINARRAYELAVTAELRKCFREPDGLDEEEFGPTKLSITVDDDGGVTNFKLTGSSGSKALDRAALAAVKCIKKIGAHRPKNLDRTLLVRFIPP